MTNWFYGIDSVAGLSGHWVVSAQYNFPTKKIWLQKGKWSLTGLLLHIESGVV